MANLTHYAKTMAMSVYMSTVGGRGAFSALKEKTAFVEPGVISDEVCAELRVMIDRLADMPKHPRVWRDEVGSDTRILGFEQDMGEAMAHLDVPGQIAAVDAYTGTRTRSWFLMANRVLPKENNLGSGGGLHRDSPFSHQVKCIWYLSDVTAETGPFQYVPGTHANLLKTQDRYPLGQTRFDRVEDALVEVHAGAGALLVCDTRCVHGGKPVEAGARYAITLYTMAEADGAEKTFRKSGLDPAFVRPAAQD